MSPARLAAAPLHGRAAALARPPTFDYQTALKALALSISKVQWLITTSSRDRCPRPLSNGPKCKRFLKSQTRAALSAPRTLPIPIFPPSFDIATTPSSLTDSSLPPPQRVPCLRISWSSMHSTLQGPSIELISRYFVLVQCNSLVIASLLSHFSVARSV